MPSKIDPTRFDPEGAGDDRDGAFGLPLAELWQDIILEYPLDLADTAATLRLLVELVVIEEVFQQTFSTAGPLCLALGGRITSRNDLREPFLGCLARLLGSG